MLRQLSPLFPKAIARSGMFLSCIIGLWGWMGQVGLAANRHFVGPAENTIVQQGANGTADIEFLLTPSQRPGQASLRPIGKTGQVRRAAVAAGKTTGRFTGVRPGWYTLCVEGEKQECRQVGVGELFLVAGQSNAVSPVTKYTPVPVSATGMVAVSAHHGDGDENVGKTPDIDTMLIASPQVQVRAGGCWVRLGDMLAKKYNMPIGFVIVAKSATNTDCWHPGKGACWPLMDKALSSRRFRAVLWHQGESDVMAGFPMEHSLANMEALVAASLRIQPGIPWFVARNSLKRDGIAYADQPVRKAQEALIAEGRVCAGPDTDVIREHPGWVGVADFGGGGIDYHGELWFPVVDACLSGKTCHRETKEVRRP